MPVFLEADKMIEKLESCIQFDCSDCPHKDKEHCDNDLMREAIGVLKKLREENVVYRGAFMFVLDMFSKNNTTDQVQVPAKCKYCGWYCNFSCHKKDGCEVK